MKSTEKYETGFVHLSSHEPKYIHYFIIVH